MRSSLARLGRFAYRHPLRVLAIWALVLAAVAALLATQPKVIATGLSIADTPSQVALDDLRAALPDLAGTQGMLVVTAADGGRVDSGERGAALAGVNAALVQTGVVVDREARLVAQRAELSASVEQELRRRVPVGTDEATIQRLISTKGAEMVSETTGRLDALRAGAHPAGSALKVGGREVPGVLVSADGRVALVPVALTGQVAELPSGTLEKVIDAATATLDPVGLRADASASLRVQEAPIGGKEAIGVGIALLVLLVTLGSVVAAGLPVLTALMGVFIGVGTAFALSSHYTMTTSTPALGLMIGLAVGIDYALFILYRQRVLILREGRSAQDAVAEAMASAGSAVLFAGSTVVIALLGLLLVRIPFVSTMALTAAGTVAVAVAISLTALPALLGIAGDRVVSRRARARAQQPQRTRVASAWARVTTRHPWLVTLVVVGLLALAAVPAASMRLGMPSGATSPIGSSARTAYDATATGFGEGTNGALLVTVRSPGGWGRDLGVLEAWSTELSSRPHVVNVQLAGVDAAHMFAVFAVTPESGPTAASTEVVVNDLREMRWLSGSGRLSVTGPTAMNIDLSARIASVVPRYVLVVVGLSLLILLVAFRSVLIPVLATGGFLLTIAATMGLTSLIFGDTRFTGLVGLDRAGPVLSFLPLMATGILYGLAMDYQVFLVASVREERAQGRDARLSVVTGFKHASRVVVAAATIMVSVFGGFVLSSDPTIVQLGVALSLGILLDAFVIRMTLMPALLHRLGEHAWWLPRWLASRLPELEV